MPETLVATPAGAKRSREYCLVSLREIYWRRIIGQWTALQGCRGRREKETEGKDGRTELVQACDIVLAS
jgi:hypothetical protein